MKIPQEESHAATTAFVDRVRPRQRDWGMTPRPASRARRLACLALALAACSPATARDDASPSLHELASPAGAPSGEPFLSADQDGGIHLSWLERSGDSTFALRYARVEGDTWSTPQTIAERADFFVNWADFPSVTSTTDGALVAHWLQRRAGGKYSYDVMLTRSRDGGRTWSAGEVLHRDGIAAEHGFVALWPTEAGGMAAAWLDGRATADRDPARRAMTVYTTTIGADGTLGAESELDARTCDCCQVAATLTPRGAVVAYRDRSDAEVRDIAVVRQSNGEWTAPAIVHADNWQIAACPVNGPALASRGDTVVIAWFTGAQDTARVRVAYSTDAGATFGPPQRIDDGMPAGRVDVEMLDDGSAAVSWLERTASGGAEVRLRRVRPDGSAGAAVVLAQASAARASGFPRLARRGGELFAAWTDTGTPADSQRVAGASGADAAPSRVRIARFRLDALP